MVKGTLTIPGQEPWTIEESIAPGLADRAVKQLQIMCKARCVVLNVPFDPKYVIYEVDGKVVDVK